MKVNLNHFLDPNVGIGRKHVKTKLASCLLFGILSIQPMDGLSAQTVTLNESKATLKQVLQKISMQTKMDLIGDVSSMSGASLISINANSKNLNEVLEDITKNQPVTAKVVNGTIVVAAAVNPHRESASVKNNQKVEQQVYRIGGVVRDHNGDRMSGVTVKVEGQSNIVTVTNDQGEYSIELPKKINYRLSFSMLGYQTLEVEGLGRDYLSVNMSLRDNNIEEAVVTGYGARNKETMTGASTIITRKELEKFNNNNIFSIIQSVDPAFKIGDQSIAGSNPNVLPQITVRGTNSVGEYAVNAPLVILDGFEVPLERLYDLDVNRIESISLLKDASTTVLYGSRGGNGVLVVETRMPKDGKLSVTYELKPVITAVDLRDYNLMNASQKLEFERLAGVYTVDANNNPRYNNVTQSRLDNIYNNNKAQVLEGVNTDWIVQPVETNVSLAHSIRIEGGGNDVRYSIDGSYNDAKGGMKGSGRRRTGAGFNLIYRVANKITFRNNASFQNAKGYNSPYGSFSRYAKMNPYQPIYDLNGNLVVEYPEEFNSVARYNPIYDASLRNVNYSETSVISNNLSFEWFISPEWTIRSKGQIVKTFLNGEKYLSPFHSSFLTTDVSERGSYTIENGDGLDYSANIQLTYGKIVGKHVLSTNLVGEINSGRISSTSHLLTGFTTDKYVSPSLALQYALNSKPTYSSVPDRLVSTMFSGSYSYDRKYNLDASYRLDGSSKFGKNSRFGNFWSVGASYNLHQEEFFKNDFIDELRLYANTGVTGSDSFSAKMTSTSYVVSSNSVYFNEMGLAYINEGNSYLKWPKILQNSLGIGGRLWDSRVSFNLSYYNKTTDGMIALTTVAPSLGIANNAYFENMGKAQNKGFEASLNFRVLENDSKAFSWFIGASGLRNKSVLSEVSEALRQLNENNLKKQEDGTYPQTVYYQEGESLNNIKGVRSLGIDPASGREVFLDRDGNRTYDWDSRNLTIIGNSEAKLFGNVNTTIDYKTFSLQAFFDYSLGGDVYNKTLIDKVENVVPYLNADLRVLEERWKQPGDVALYKSIASSEVTLLTSRFVQQENFLRLSSININYDFSKDFIRKFKLERFRLNASMNDVFRWSTVRMERGIEYPFARTFNFGILAQF